MAEILGFTTLDKISDKSLRAFKDGAEFLKIYNFELYEFYMGSIREEVLQEIERAKLKLGTRWYLWFGNFAMLTAIFRETSGVNEYLRENPGVLDELCLGQGSSDLLKTKTQRQFYQDIDQAFRDSGNYDLMIERGRLRTEGILSGTSDGDKLESEFSVTFIEPFTRLREMGYSHGDLT